MYNFLDSRLSPKVSTSTPCTDGYEITNLISNDSNPKGFLAYTAIKPPVDIVFDLICPVSLSYILIWPSIGSQKSTGFEIQAKTDRCDYVTICRAFIKEPGLVACSRKVFNENRSKPEYPSDFAVYYFKSSEFKTFVSCKHVRVRIFHTASSVPCLNKIEIWGEIALSCSEQTKKTIQYLISKNKSSATDKVESIVEDSSRNFVNDAFHIPEDFQDAITYEIMCLPMTLPSGKNIDQSTLEKHNDSEAKWGRRPSDPFTGQAFTENRKPVLNLSLKCRIEDFLLKNNDRDDLKYVPRTVGRSKETVTQNAKRIKLDQGPSSSRVSVDLDELIKHTLVNYNIVRYSSIDVTDPVKHFCEKCKCENNLYKLPCTHLTCRQCLINILECICFVCNENFGRNEVQKFHDK